MTKNRYSPYTNTEITRAVRLRMAEWHPEQIAGMTGRTKVAIDRLLSIEAHKHGHKYPPLPRKNLKWTDQRVESMVMCYPRKNYRELGHEHNVSKERIHALMAKRAHGLQQGTWMG